MLTDWLLGDLCCLRQLSAQEMSALLPARAASAAVAAGGGGDGGGAASEGAAAPQYTLM